MKQAELLDRCMEKLGKTTDYALANSLGIPTNRISDYRKGKVNFDEWTYFKIGDVLGESPAFLMACILAENHKNTDKRLIFKDFLTRVGLWIILAVIPVNYVSFSDNVQAAGNTAETRADWTYKPIMRSRKIWFLLRRWMLIMDKNVRYFTCNWTRKAACGSF